MALQHKSKLQVYRELKEEIRFEEYLEYVKWAHSRMLLKFRWDTSGLFEELGRHDEGVGHRSVLIMGLVWSRLSIFFLSVHCMLPRDQIFWTI